MKINTKDLSLADGITKEWIITNGIGGYCASTVFGINTRKYHGLLVAALTPPARRHVILSKLDESIEINNKKYNLYSNMCKDYIADGYKNQIEFWNKKFSDEEEIDIIEFSEYLLNNMFWDKESDIIEIHINECLFKDFCKDNSIDKYNICMRNFNLIKFK